MPELDSQFPSPGLMCGVVVIGRNEGERLRVCLRSALGGARVVVYVDSGSTDGSLAMAIGMGAFGVDLDISTPFTAARARNAGFEKLLQIEPALQFVQFIDGDCEMVAGWLLTAEAFLQEHPTVAIAAGRVRERSPRASIYNQLCDLEWHAPAGEIHWCGGNVMVRTVAFREAGGFNPAFIAGEEPELCVRLREKKWTLHRLDADVALHDADMHRFSQWWQRTTRAGYAFAEGAHTHGWRPERYCVREVRSGWAWGLLLPLTGLGLAWLTNGWSVLAMLAIYAAQFFFACSRRCAASRSPKARPPSRTRCCRSSGNFHRRPGNCAISSLACAGKKVI